MYKGPSLYREGLPTTICKTEKQRWRSSSKILSSRPSILLAFFSCLGWMYIVGRLWQDADNRTLLSNLLIKNSSQVALCCLYPVFPLMYLLSGLKECMIGSIGKLAVNVWLFIKNMGLKREVIDMEHELQALRAQLVEKSKRSIELQKEVIKVREDVDKSESLMRERNLKF